MKAIEIKPGIHWVGAKDWNVRDFHGYQTQGGTSYNAYLIIDEKIVLIDTVKSSHYKEMLERIKNIVDLSQIDIIVSNHVEPDHSGALPEILEQSPKARILTSVNGVKGLKAYYDTSSWNLQVVKSEEEVNIGKRNLKFIHTPMVHWPDSMVTYLPEEKLLFPNDAFGQHIAIDNLFDHQNPKDIIFQELSKYYANIVYPFGSQVNKVLQALAPLKIEMIAPSHGIIWTKYIPEVLEKYGQWANNENKNKAVVVYDSMWGCTAKMAQIIQSSFEESNVPVTLRSLKYCHISDVVNDILEAKYVAIGSPTLNNTVLPTVGSLLTYLKGLQPKNKIGLAFGSYGWNPKALKEVKEFMDNLGWTIPAPLFNVKYRPNEEDIVQLNTITKNICNQFS